MRLTSAIAAAFIACDHCADNLVQTHSAFARRYGIAL
jgi:hypothetical protein